MGPICLIIDDEGAISCLRFAGRGPEMLGDEGIGKLECCVLLIPVGVFCNYCGKVFLNCQVTRLIPVFPAH